MPYYPVEDKTGHEYEIYTTWDHLICEYTGLNIYEVQNLDYIDYLVYRHDAFIDKLSQTEAGNEYLDKAWRLKQTAPDKGSLRDRFGGG